MGRRGAERFMFDFRLLRPRASARPPGSPCPPGGREGEGRRPPPRGSPAAGLARLLRLLGGLAVLGLLAPAALADDPPAGTVAPTEPAALPEPAAAAEILADTVREIRARLQVVSREAAEAAALREQLAEARGRIAELETGRPVAGGTPAADQAAALRTELAEARARIAELEAARRAAVTPAVARSDQPATDVAAREDPPVLALLGLAAAMLLGFAAVGFCLWRLHRRLRRSAPDDLLDRLVRVEQAHRALYRMQAERPDWRPPPVRAVPPRRDGGAARGVGG